MDLKETLAFFRKKQGLSQMELAEALEVSRQTVSKWETGAALPSAENLLALSKLYGVSVDALLNGENEAEPLAVPTLLDTVLPPPTPHPSGTLRLVLQILAVTLLCNIPLFLWDISLYAIRPSYAFNLIGLLLRLCVCCTIGLSFAWWDRGRSVNKRRSLLIAAAALLLGVYVYIMPVPLLWRLYDLITGGVPFDGYFPSNPVRWFLGFTLCDQTAFFSHACLVAAFQLGRLWFSSKHVSRSRAVS